MRFYIDRHLLERVKPLFLVCVIAIFIFVANTILGSGKIEEPITEPQELPAQHIVVLNKDLAISGCRYTLAVRGYSYIYESRTEERLVVIEACDLYEESDTLWIVGDHGQER